MAGMVAIITLAFILATGILLVILSCALDNNWLPLLVVLTYLLAPIPNSIAGRLANRSDYFSDDTNSGALEIGYFMTALFIISGFGLPIVLNHANIITNHSMIMSVLGGLLIYGTIIGYIHFFTERQEEY